MVHTLLLQFGWLTFRFLPILTLVVASLSAAVQHGEAQNMGFTPGDAFFVFDLTEKLVSGLPEKGGEVTLYYPTPLIGFGGYAGFDKWRLERVTPELVQYLRRVYQDHRRWTPKIVRIDLFENATTRRGGVTGKQDEMMADLVLLNLQSWGIREKADGLLWKLWLTTGMVPTPREDNESLSANLSRNAKEYREYVTSNATATEAEIVRRGLTNAVDSFGSPLWYPTMKYVSVKTAVKFECIISIHVSPPRYIIENPLSPESYKRLSSVLSAWLDANSELMVWHPNAHRYRPSNRKYVGVAELSRELWMATER